MASLKDRSKFLSLVLRHQPDKIKLQLDPQGWVDVTELLNKLKQHGPGYLQPFDYETLEQVVAENDKKRFAFNADKTMIRASQGHSVDIKLGYDPVQPPELLYHGTAEKSVASILKQGILKGKRHHVHLSLQQATAVSVGGRHGAPVVLTVRAGDMHRAGFEFYCSENGVWLTDTVPSAYILVP